VIWGLKYKYHTHHHIHKAFYKNARKLGYDAIWLEDHKKNQKHIKQGDLIISAEVYGKMIKEKQKIVSINQSSDDINQFLYSGEKKSYKQSGKFETKQNKIK
jgi:hypothetical protein